MSATESLPARIKRWARTLRRQALIVYFAARDPRAPWGVRLLALLVAAYALSPIDLIPDFIPVLGYLDEMLLLPLAIALIIRLSPPEVIEAAREAAARSADKPVSFAAAAVIVALWCLLAVWLARRVAEHFG
jgi:uncharacterized membrane protein YkvA (DUF1232 family)